MRIPDHIVERIYEEAQVYEVLKDFMELKKRGQNYFGLSPFASEKTPSFAVSPNKNIWKDFSSGKGGNSVTFLMEAEGMDYREALEYLAEKYKIDLGVDDEVDSHPGSEERSALRIVSQWASEWFHSNMKFFGEDTQGINYLMKRGIHEEAIKTFQIGYCPDRWDAMGTAAQQHHYSIEMLIKSGLSFKSQSDGKVLDRFKGRLIFPIHDHFGKIVGFGGRILDDSKKSAKYLNSPESELYHKSRILYGLHIAKQAIREQDRAILVEGYMDVIGLWQAGIRNVVASSGTALTDDQIKALKRFTSNVILVFDGDSAGIKAALRAVDVILSGGLNPKVMMLPDGHDPDSFVKAHGLEEWQKLESAAVDFIEFKITKLREGIKWSDPVERAKVIGEVAATINLVPDPLLQSTHIQRAAQLLKIEGELLSREIIVVQGMKRTRQKPKAEFGTDKVTAIMRGEELSTVTVSLPHEWNVLAFMVNNPKSEYVELLIGELKAFEFQDQYLQQIKELIMMEHERLGWLNISPLLDSADPKRKAYLMKMMEIEDEIPSNWGKFGLESSMEVVDEYTDVLLSFKSSRIEFMITEVREASKGDNAPELVSELSKKLTYLMKLRQDINQLRV